jgi:nicotinamidase-related amidase
MREPVILTDLRDIVAPERSALLVVDPQHDFCSPQGAVAARLGVDLGDIQEAVPRLNHLVEVCRSLGLMVVWVRGAASDVRMFPNQKARRGTKDKIWLIKEGSRGADWFEGVVRPVEGEPVVTKDTYDAFEYTDLDLILRAHEISTIVVGGFTTNVCVETTARHGSTRGYYVVVVSDCTGAPTPAEHDAALFNIRTYFGHVASSDELLGAWGFDPRPSATGVTRKGRGDP